MRYFLDTEFCEDGHTIDLISIGIVAQDGREFYACNLDADLRRCHDRDSWLRENVLAPLPGYGDKAWMRRAAIRDAAALFMGYARATLSDPHPAIPVPDDKPEIWAYVGASDWVAFYQLWGRLMDMPRRFPRWCRELKQLAELVGNPPLLPRGEGAHNALEDARWNRAVYDQLITLVPAGASKGEARR